MTKFLILLFLIYPLSLLARGPLSLICVEPKSDSILEIEQNGSLMEFKIRLEQRSDTLLNFDLEEENVVNANSDIFRLYYKSFGFWNWKSIDLRYYLKYRVLRLVYRQKETGWNTKSTVSSQIIDFTDCQYQPSPLITSQ